MTRRFRSPASFLQTAPVTTFLVIGLAAALALAAARRLGVVAGVFSRPPDKFAMAGTLNKRIPTRLLRDGNQIPLLAFGTGTAWFKEPDDTEYDPGLVAMVKQALHAGFRHLDCAEMYGNEAEVGQAIKESGIPRGELFITTKVADGIKDIPKAIEGSLGKLQVDYVDLYLIHEPWNLHTEDDYRTAWKAMEKVKSTGKAKSIGVSNFVRRDLEMVLNSADDPPAVNQLEYHPYIQRVNDGEYFIPWMLKNDIQVEAFKSLSPVARCPEGPLIEPLTRIAERHRSSITAVMLSWYLKQGIVAITTTRSKERLQEYTDSLTVNLTEEEIGEITKVGGKYWRRWYFPERYAEDDRS